MISFSEHKLTTGQLLFAQTASCPVIWRIYPNCVSYPYCTGYTGYPIYGFTTFYTAIAYGLVLIGVVFGAWLLCDHYREQAQATVIYKQAQEAIRERDYYYNQIQNYKRNNSTYARLFPAYDDKGFWDQFNKP